MALIDRARRHCAGLWFLEGFAEELEVHFTHASELANEIHDPGDFYEHALLKDETNGFLDAFINWSDRSGRLATFKEYCEDSGLSAPIKNRVRGIGITVAEPRRFQGAHYEVAAKTAAAMGGQHRRKLAEHEGDQIAQLSFENAGKASVSSTLTPGFASSWSQRIRSWLPL